MAYLFLISGVGADHRIFSKLKVEGYQLVYVPFFEPVKNETLSAYALRMNAQLPADCEINLAGFSFGGIVSQEIKLIRKHKTNLILLSSILGDEHLNDTLSKLIAGIVSIIPKGLFVNPIFLNKAIVGVKTNEDFELAKAMMVSQTGSFVRWAIRKVLTFRLPASDYFLRMHGVDDLTFPSSKIKNGILVKDAGHIMPYTHADVANIHLNENLKHLPPASLELIEFMKSSKLIVLRNSL